MRSFGTTRAVPTIAMTKAIVTTLNEIELSSVTGGWDWARTGRAALTGAGLTFNASVGAGRNLAGTPGAYAGGALGAVSSLVGPPARMFALSIFSSDLPFA